MQITGKFENERLICTRMERLYLYKNSTQICAQTGFQGYLRGHFDKCGETYFDTYFPHKTPADEGFFGALQKVVDTLRDDGMLQSFRTMKNWCITDGWDSHFDGNWTDEFAFRIDHNGFAFLFRLIPMMGDYHVYVHCYKANWLDQHMEQAETGIRFINSEYQEQFRLEDGGRIQVIEADGTNKQYTCRYVDDYHAEIGNNLFHICEFAESIEAAGKRVEPISGLMLKKNAKSFMEDLTAQKVQCGCIDAYVEFWHTHETGNELPAFLGMTDAEYAEWLANGLDETLLRFAEARRSCEVRE